MSKITLKTCRICLEKEGCVLLTERKLNISLKEMIVELSNIYISEDNSFPSTLCKKCVKNVQDFYLFRKQIQVADMKIHEIFDCKVSKYSSNNSIAVFEKNQSDISDSEDDQSNENSVLFSVLEIKEEKPYITLVKTDIKETEPILDKSTNNQNIKLKKKHRKKVKIDKSVESRTCKDCGKIFSTVNNLKIHCIVHSGVKPYKCEVCEKCFTQQSSLISHKQIHDVDKLYICEFCSKQFSKNNYLKKHMATHKPETIKLVNCDLCGKGFRDKGDLKRHLAVHENLKHYSCGVCGKGFNYHSSLKRHYRTVHLNIKDHICSYCGKTFSSNANLIAHFRIHTGEKPFECQYCDAKFNQSTPHVRHSQIHIERGDQKRI